MKTLKIFLFANLMLCSLISFSQLKVDQYGRIGMGTNYPNPVYKCHIKGNLLLTTYPSSPWIEFQFKIGNGWPGSEFGTNVDKIAVWASYVGYNKLYAEEYYKMSDASFKSNISPILSPLTKILQLKPYIYDFQDNYITENGDSLTGVLRQYGFISQEIELSLPDVKITEDGKDGKLMDYDQIIPLLVAGMQDQQNQIKALEAQIAKLIATSNNGSGNSNGNGSGSGGGTNNNPMDLCKLFTNSPNPFTSNSNIPYYLCASTTTAEIKIWDMQGIERKVIILNTQQGNGNIIVQASDLPASGSYVYALFANGLIIDAKTMVRNF